MSTNVTRQGERPVARVATAAPGTAIAVGDLVGLVDVDVDAYAGLDVEADIAGESSWAA